MRETRGDATRGKTYNRIVGSTVEDRKERVGSKSVTRDYVVRETGKFDQIGVGSTDLYRLSGFNIL